MSDSPPSSADIFLAHVTQSAGDPTYSVLKAHLLLEQLLRKFVESNVPYPDQLDKARLSFAQTLALARSMSRRVGRDAWQWDVLSMLNGLRNELAHRLEPAQVKKKMDAIVQLTIRESPVPFPAPFVPGAQIAQQGSMFLAIDVALIGLYCDLRVRFGLEDAVGAP